MGEHNVDKNADAAELRLFVRALLRDLRALETMLDEGQIESDKDRIGAEQELFLVDDQWRAFPVAQEVLDRCTGFDATPELAKFNIEFNLKPLELEGDCLRRLHHDLDDGFARVRAAAKEVGAHAVMVGILPTLAKSDLGLDNMIPSPRYFALNDALMRQRGADYEFRIKGTDELILQHDSMMVEACNTSFQVHMQIRPQEFARFYNAAQLIAGPVLAACTNSPLLFGKRLWRETRIALFQQSLDTRIATHHHRETSPRVSFGTSWVERDVLEIFREDIARFRVLLGIKVREDPFEALAEGRPPTLDALRLHNGTVYRWNRPCYGVSEGKPHLRIENRILPAGPTVIDEVANAAFWLGALRGAAAKFENIPALMQFDDAKANMVAAARQGLGAHMLWFDAAEIASQDLILERLLPLAYDGLDSAGLDPVDRDEYLGIIEKRVKGGKTGAQWQISSFNAVRKVSSRSEALAAVTAGFAERQVAGQPVHTWSVATVEEGGGWCRHHQYVGQFMTTDLFTVNQDEVVDLVATIMDWQHFRHVPVEDHENRLVGLVSHRSLLRLIARGWTPRDGETVAVSEIMQKNLVTVDPDSTTLNAIQVMRRHKVSCLPVVKDGRLVGLITERDLVRVAAPLLERALAAPEDSVFDQSTRVSTATRDEVEEA